MSEPRKPQDEPCFLLRNSALHDFNKCVNEEHLKGSTFREPSMLRPPTEINLGQYVGPADASKAPLGMHSERTKTEPERCGAIPYHIQKHGIYSEAQCTLETLHRGGHVWAGVTWYGTYDAPAADENDTPPEV